MTSRPSTAARHVTIAVAVFALVVVPLGVYAGGYFGLGLAKFWRNANQSAPEEYGKLVSVERSYPQQWMATVFRPAAKLEGWLRGIDVQATREIPPHVDIVDDPTLW